MQEGLGTYEFLNFNLFVELSEGKLRPFVCITMAHARIEQFEAKLAITSGRREAAEAFVAKSQGL